MVVVHVAADSLSRKRILAASADPTEDVPAGTLPTAQGADPTCHIDGVGPIEPETARRLAQVRNATPERIAEITTQNFDRLCFPTMH